MKKLLIISVCIFCVYHSYGFETQLKYYELSDGVKVLGRLCTPDDGVFNTIVFAVHGTGQQTHLNFRKGDGFQFSYYDDLANGFCSRGVAFFTYDRRGVCVDEDGLPPLFVKTDSLVYSQYTPYREVEDVENILSNLISTNHYENHNIILYGLSEGTIISAIVAERNNVKVDALLLHGYANDNMYDILRWQNAGHGVMIMANQYFDNDGDGKISSVEYSEDAPIINAYRSYLFQNLPFETIDVNHDGFITVEDIGEMRSELDKNLMEAIKRDDDQWIANNYMKLTSNWFKAHFTLEANKSRLLRLELPIHIFHGTHDTNVPVESVYDIKERFRILNKSNLVCNIFDEHNHDLNFGNWLTHKIWPEGMLKIFETAAEISQRCD